MKRPLTALVAFLWAVDTAATCAFVTKFGVESEANPLMAYVMTSLGMYGFVAVKASVIVFFLCVSKHMPAWLIACVAFLLLPVAVAGSIMAWS